MIESKEALLNALFIIVNNFNDDEDVLKEIIMDIFNLEEPYWDHDEEKWLTENLDKPGEFINRYVI